MGLFFDAFPKAVPGKTHTFDSGQPIQTPTVLSVDDLGRLTVAVSTGDQDTGGTATGLTNYVWSLTEELADGGQAFETKVNWFQPLLNGERVTGPMSLFTGTLYFSTFSPPATGDSVCNSGSSKLWGVDYLLPEPEGSPGAGGLPTTLTDNDVPVQFLEFANLVVGGDANVKPVVFGVTIAQLPTCFENTSALDDEWLGYGTHEAMNQINPGKFELVVHTGQAGTNVPGGTTNVFKMELPTPPALTSIDSWAAIVE
jgi:type IV pilus assembly protein PilY1